MTAGFNSAFEVAGLFAIFGFVAALTFVRHRRAPAAIEVQRQTAEIAA